MFVERMEIVRDPNSTTVEKPSWETVEAAIRGITALEEGGIILEGAGAAYMGIVGNVNQLVVAGKRKDGSSFIMTNGTDGNDVVVIAIGGQDNTYMDNEVVSLELAILAAETFFQTGTCDSQFRWNEKPAKM